jgi:hypothetical protein
MVSLSDSTEHLENLGAGELLVNSGELQKAEKFADRRLTAIAYLSEDFVARLAGTPEDLDDLPSMAEQLLEGAEIDEDLEAAILMDVKTLAEDLKPHVPEPGPSLSFSFLTPRGLESYTYNWTQNLTLIGDKRLDLLEHVGSTPLVAFVARNRVSIEDYQLLVKWAKIGWGYVTRLAVPTMKDDDKAQFDKVVEKFTPLVQRLHQVTETKLLPALADGQIGLVWESHWKSRQWVKQWPATEQPMPLPEGAIVLGVSDAKLFKSALGEYLEIVEAGLGGVRELNPQAIPADLKVPPPDETRSGTYETFAYHIPAEAGVDPQVVPNMGLGEHVAVFCLSLDQTARLLKSTPFKGEGPLADAKQPLAAAGVLDWAGLVNLVSPWVELGAKQYGPQIVNSMLSAAKSNGDPDDDDAADAPADRPAEAVKIDPAAIAAQIHDFLMLAKTLRTVTFSAQIDEEAEAVVQRLELHFEDLP